MSRKPTQHSYASYTGKPYIYYNGINYNQNTSCPKTPEHPFRTIVRSIKPDGEIMDHVPSLGMGHVDGIKEGQTKYSSDPTDYMMKHPDIMKQYMQKYAVKSDKETFTLDEAYTSAARRQPTKATHPSVNAKGCPDGRIWSTVARKDNLYQLYVDNNDMRFYK